MNNLVDLLDLFNFIDRADWLLAALKYRDLGRTVKIEHADKKKKGHTGNEYEAMLKKYHVVVFGRRATSKHLIFSVKTAQAEYAEYLLLRYGAKVVSRFNPKNAGWASKHNGVMPTPWDSKKKK